jgi:3'-phosphoadenosine 5'-phosphosulfate sulfotransferase (PAPS reductase)/FAD synthetase
MRLLTVLNYSGGRQSTCLLEMVLRGEIAMPRNFVVLNADPGMENKRTYELVASMKQRCADAGVRFETVQGRNLYQDLLGLVKNPKRIDNPPFWTKDKNGKIGRLNQKCTDKYKIKPMDQAVRRILKEKYRISIKTKRIMTGAVEKWIGMAADETRRISEPKAKYQFFRYPLMEMGMTTSDVTDYFIKRGLPMPPRSVCNACFANGLTFFRDMANERPEDFEMACKVDDIVRHGLKCCGVHDEVYVSSTCIPLRQLHAMNFKLPDIKEQDKHACNSGYCFV